jgi:predicted cupin superfamily sugar epimerase
VRSDELWHFYLGGPFELVEILPSGEVTRTRLGQDLDSGCVVQHVVRAGSWFGGAPEAGAAYSFVGCTVAPGFDFSDFELGRRDDLLRLFPGAEREILALTD